MKLRKLLRVLDPTQFMEIRIKETDATIHSYPNNLSLKYFNCKIVCVYTVPSDDDVLHVIIKGV